MAPILHAPLGMFSRIGARTNLNRHDKGTKETAAQMPENWVWAFAGGQRSARRRPRARYGTADSAAAPSMGRN